jgi:23S rRNA (cytidine1920-2'-O)/16S rRNA (cytidine1409-2'-O)-methyltransferase
MKAKPTRTRLDIALVERGLTASQKEAQAMILAGEVKVDGATAQKAGVQVARGAKIEFTRQQKYVSRGGLKLEGALADFSVNPAGGICLDIGSSTGGFTDCLLQHGAAKVFAVDVNLAQLAWKLQHDARVIKIQRNARELSVSDVPELVSLVVVDVSFISVCKILPPAVACAAPFAGFLILIKPQFELRRQDVPAGGVVADPRLHQKAIAAVERCAISAGLLIQQTMPSRVTGAEGNQEFFLHARRQH